MKDLMLDLETLGTRPTSVIIQLGACYFNRITGEIGERFLKSIDVGDSLMQGLTIDVQTIDWWRQRPEKTWSITYHNSMVSLRQALQEFSAFTDKSTEAVWSHASFDFPILANAFQICSIKLPFHYRTARDIRTLVDLSGLDYNKEKEDKTHDALEDCLYQVKYCVECFKKLGDKNEISTF